MLFLMYRDMDNHIVSKDARDMHQYLTEVYKNKTRELLEKKYNKMLK